MKNAKIVGIVLMVVGAIALFFGYQSSQAVGQQVTELITGRYSDMTMWYLIGGAAASVAGIFLTFFKRR